LVQSGNCSIAYSDFATISVNAISKPGYISSDTTVCITSNSGTLNLNGYVGGILRWESSTDAGATWPVINNTTNTLSFSNLTSTTRYRTLVQNGICNAVYSNYVTIQCSSDKQFLEHFQQMLLFVQIATMEL
jgi:hypothetical protein